MNVIVANANGADDTWLGMTGITDGVLPSVWPFDKTPVDYIHWDKAGFSDKLSATKVKSTLISK